MESYAREQLSSNPESPEITALFSQIKAMKEDWRSAYKTLTVLAEDPIKSSSEVSLFIGQEMQRHFSEYQRLWNSVKSEPSIIKTVTKQWEEKVPERKLLLQQLERWAEQGK